MNKTFRHLDNYNHMKNNILKLLLLLLVIASCTPQSRLVYLQDKDGAGDKLPEFVGEYLVKPTDILHVRVITPDPDAHTLFNMDDSRTTRTTSTGSGDVSMYIYGYTVNRQGVIQMPVIGDVEVAGLSTGDIKQAIQIKVDEYLVGATVSVKLANFSVTVLGEVKRPGNYYVYDNKFTIMDALGIAGDLTDYGNRNVHVVRRSDVGSIFATIDITNRNAVSSELYYLQPGDLIYVEPLPAKRAGFAQFPFGVVFSAITTTLLLINFLNTPSN
jgi:polysaccharide biosynthesis/export protein